MREYTTTNDKKYLIYATREYTTIFNLHDAYYLLLERYMKHAFVAGLVTGDFSSALISTTYWYLHMFENQISRWLVIYAPCWHMWWNVSLSSQP